MYFCRRRPGVGTANYGAVRRLTKHGCSAPRRLIDACGARPRAYPADCSAGLGRLKRALSAGRSATRFAGSAMLEMLYAIPRLA